MRAVSLRGKILVEFPTKPNRFLTNLCCFFKVRSKLYAVPAPRSVEIDDPGVLTVENVIKECLVVELRYQRGKVLEGPAVERIHVTPTTVAPAWHKKKQNENSANVTRRNSVKKTAQNLALVVFWMLKERLNLVPRLTHSGGREEERPWERESWYFKSFLRGTKLPPNWPKPWNNSSPRYKNTKEVQEEIIK